MDRTGFEPATPWSEANVVPPAFAGFRRFGATRIGRDAYRLRM